jgi:hypothetical protein
MRNSFAQKLKDRLQELNIIIKLLMLALGAALFFLLFPFLLKWGGALVYLVFFILLLVAGALFRVVSGRRAFRVTLWLWLSGSIIYMIIASILILRGVQPLPYMRMDRVELILYYLSYPLRVLGIFFTGLIFSAISSPVEFLKWGGFGMKIALAYRAFEYAVNAFETNREALLIQDEWPDFSKGVRRKRGLGKVFKATPALVATTFRNIILWFPWAWVCYTSLQKEVMKRGDS